MTSETQLLTEAQLKEAVELFATGMSRQDVASHFIDTDERLAEIDAKDSTLREKLADVLRAADPTSTKFAITKYGEDYKLKREAIKQALANQYENLLTASTEVMMEEIADLREKRSELDHMLENAREQNPVGTSEYLATLNARNSITKRMTELGESLLERLERIKNQNDAF